jgi:hypothetical protein
MTAAWRKLHNETRQHLYSGDEIKEDGMVRSLGRPRRRWEDNTKMHRVKIMLDGVDLIYLGHDKAGSCEHGNERPGSIKGADFLD